MRTTEGCAHAADGAQLYGTSAGEGPPLLLIAGQASGHRGWMPVVPHLAEHHRVVRFDHRGVGRSSSGADDRFTTRGFVHDAATALADAGIDFAHVDGHSIGGRVAQWLAIDHPALVDRLVLASTTGGDRRDGPRAPGVDAALASGDIAQMAPLFFTEDFLREQPAAVEQFFLRDAPVRVRAPALRGQPIQ